MRPCRRLRHIPVLDRIVVDVINVCLQIPFVPYQMLPIAALPDTTLPFRSAARAYALSLWNATREVRLDERPARRIVRIARRQLPDRMKMIRHHHHGHNLEGVAEFDDADGFTQPIYLLDQQRAFTVRKRNSKEIRAAWNQRSP